MILVTLGTQDKKFYRLLDAIQKQIDLGNIKDKVVVQAGCSSDYESKDMEIFDLIPMEEFDNLISKCDLLITHGGVGSIITGLKNNKKVIAAARLAEYKEHTNNHQLQIIENFSNSEYILNLSKFDDLGDMIKNIDKFKPKKYKSNTNKFIKLIQEEIDTNKKKDSKKKINILFLISILLFISFSLIKSIFKPIDILSNENRYASKYQNINIKSYLNGDMQDNFENTLSDQLIYSSKMKSINNMFNTSMMKYYINKITSNDNQDYYNLGGISLYGNDNLVYRKLSLAEIKNDLNSRVDSLNRIMELYPNVEYYFYYIEHDADIDFNDNSKLLAYETLIKNLNSSNTAKFQINNFDEFKEYYYKVDHHWNYKGSYKGYKEILNLLNIDGPKEILSEKCFDGKFSGSKGNSVSSALYYEKLCTYIFDYNDIETYINGEKSVYGKQQDYLEGKNMNFTYGDYYGSDYGEIIFDSHNDSKDNILIIGNSFDNAILRLLSEKFNKTISIDLRTYNYDTKKEFNFGEYLKEYNINKVLFIGQVNFWFSEEYNITK